jgi:hypothetical protein
MSNKKNTQPRNKNKCTDIKATDTSNPERGELNNSSKNISNNGTHHSTNKNLVPPSNGKATGFSTPQFPLYQTFNKNIPVHQVPENDVICFTEKIDSFDVVKKTALIRLILEHFKFESDAPVDFESVSKFPYGGQIEESLEMLGHDTINLNFYNFPLPLQWILWRFYEICMSNEFESKMQ